jgi:hypothetical protein
MQAEDKKHDRVEPTTTVVGPDATGCPHAAAAAAAAAKDGNGTTCPHQHQHHDDLRDLERLVHLRKKMMIKHASSRMTAEYAITWLKLMLVAVDKVFPSLDGDGNDGEEENNDEEQRRQRWQLRYSLSCYWLHFYALFPYSDDERQQFRDVVFPNTHSVS